MKLVSELALTILRVGFVALLWLFVIFVLYVLWQGLKTSDPIGSNEEAWPSTSASGLIKRFIFRVRPSELVVRSGTSQGLRVPLNDEIIRIGRSADNTLILDEEFISDHHAAIRKLSDRWVIEDLASTNGTWLRGERVTLAKQLKVGTYFGVGDVVLEVR